MSRWINLLLIIQIFLNHIVSANFVRNYTYCKVLDNEGVYKLHWNISGEVFQAALEVSLAGWVALGISTGGSEAMISNGLGSDIFLGWVSQNGNCSSGCVGDYLATDYILGPQLDPHHDVTLISASRNTELIVEIERKLITGDTQYDRPITLDKLMTFIWAYNPDPNASPSSIASSIKQHLPSTRGTFTFKLSDPSTCQASPNVMSYSYTNADNTWSVTWNVNGNQIYFEVSGKTNGWVGIGFSNQASMKSADLVVGWIGSSGVANITDYFSVDRDPTLDTQLGGTNDVKNISGERTGDWPTVIRFTRMLDTGDNYDTAIPNSEIYLLWAYGDDNSVDLITGSFNEHVSKGLVLVNFFDGSVQDVSSVGLVKAHAILMIFVWVIMIPIAAFVSRYMKNQFAKWFNVHWGIILLAIILLIISFICILVYFHGILEVGIHQMLGIFVIVLTAIEGMLGIGAHLMFQRKRTEPPIFPDRIHWYLARAIFALVILTLFFGLNQYDANPVSYVFLSLWLIFVITMIILLQLKVGQVQEIYEELQNEEEEFHEQVDYKNPQIKKLFVIQAVGVTVLGLILTGIIALSE